MQVSRSQIVVRGLTNCCPNCGARTLFKAGKLFEVNKECPACGLKIERANDEGFFLGSMSLNYGVTLVVFLVPVMLFAYFDVIGLTAAIVLAGVGSILITWFCLITCRPIGCRWRRSRTKTYSRARRVFSASVFSVATYVFKFLRRRGGRVV